MGRSVHMPELPRIAQHTPHARQPAAAAEHRLSLTVEAGRTAQDMALLSQVAMTALTGAGASNALAQQAADAARIAAHYVIGHTSAPRICLAVDANATTVTMTVSDYSPEPAWGPSAWLPVTSDNALFLDGVQPGVDPLTVAARGEGLQLHRTCDGHVRLGTHTPWEAAGTRRS
ncbi:MULTISPECIES: hypothetical protein [Streptomyces]|uniref:Uncharacterized protein n=3 Tax=Streptomyces rimosus TaxID=1927 RepID=A0A8A1V6H6_STRR1|nr:MULTISPECIES: hypothetical protein [Streptomyces]MYT44636.1 hypothetical protein [Streptomyces sp. SID5471]QGY71068.1 hypothetical protein V519_039000 [Streptomyces rimosus R6-500]QST86604.1 hypothetical protein SRIM_041015 [Streptomyces rimosus subsp. rimosus ATCC 10970]QTL84551.1 hypothetical protein FMM49_00935 [Streptomyces rimosus subsp. rimosus]QXV92160.1 hypothetical protein M4018_083610 [Streptomyces rimosus]